MIRDLVEASIHMVREEMEAEVEDRASEHAVERVLDALYPSASSDGSAAEQERSARTREKLEKMYHEGHLDDRMVEIELSPSPGDAPGLQFLGSSGLDQMGVNLQDMLSGLMPSRPTPRKVTVAEARELFAAQAASELVDQDKLKAEALRRVQDEGIVFVDEIDKIAVANDDSRGADVSRQGVQRDILPIVEGSTVTTRHGQVKTDHILFIAAGAFHVAKPSDLIPELQGRFPIRVELDALTTEDLRRILVEPDNALIRQYQATMATEDVQLSFDDAAIARIASMAAEVNSRSENIGARRLHTIMEALLEELSFAAPERAGEAVRIDVAEVERRLTPILADEDLSRYIL
jgi:ATP-dependent HslUV protease ATP-binding subunit HslU